MKEAKIDLQKSSISVVHMLGKLGYIDKRTHDDLLNRVKTGDVAVYGELKGLLVGFADILGRLN